MPDELNVSDKSQVNTALFKSTQKSNLISRFRYKLPQGNKRIIFLVLVIIAVPVTIGLALVQQEDRSHASESESLCVAAIPTDQIPDDAALQACLDQGGIIKLSAGDPGYIIATGVLITKDNTTLTSQDPNNRAKLLADPNLLNPILKTSSVNNSGLILKDLIVDGNRLKRTTQASCPPETSRGKGINLILNGSNFTVDHVDVVNALCNASFNIGFGTNFEIKNSRVADGGYKDGETSKVGDWHLFADGLTVGKCDHGNIHDNVFENNTDTNLIIGGGPSCIAVNNIIRQTTRFGHAGFWLNNFKCCGMGDHTGSNYANNKIYATPPGALGAGLLVNQNIALHTTDPQLSVKNVKIINNTISGTGDNLLIGGDVDNIWAEGNVMSNPVGKVGGTAFGNGCGKDEHYNYTAGNFTNSHLQAGYKNKTFDNFGCQTTPPPPDNPIGSLDNPSCTVITGWSCNEADYSSSVNVKLYDGPMEDSASPIADGVANQSRGDIADQCGGVSNHGFNITTPIGIKNGDSHEVWAYPVNEDGSISADKFLDSPKEISCPGTGPTPIPTPTPVPGCIRTDPTVYIIDNTKSGKPTDTVTYRVGVKDNDTTQCTYRKLTLKLTIPTNLKNWTSHFSHLIIINPNQTKIVNINVTSGKYASPGVKNLQLNVQGRYNPHTQFNKNNQILKYDVKPK